MKFLGNANFYLGHQAPDYLDLPKVITDYIYALHKYGFRRGGLMPRMFRQELKRQWKDGGLAPQREARFHKKSLLRFYHKPVGAKREIVNRTLLKQWWRCFYGYADDIIAAFCGWSRKMMPVFEEARKMTEQINDALSPLVGLMEEGKPE